MLLEGRNSKVKRRRLIAVLTFTCSSHRFTDLPSVSCFPFLQFFALLLLLEFNWAECSSCVFLQVGQLFDFLPSDSQLDTVSDHLTDSACCLDSNPQVMLPSWMKTTRKKWMRSSRSGICCCRPRRLGEVPVWKICCNLLPVSDNVISLKETLEVTTSDS